MLYAFPAVQAAALLQAGRCYEALHEWKQAAEMYARVLKNYGQTSFAKQAALLLPAAEKRAEGAERR